MRTELNTLLEGVKNGTISVEEAVMKIKTAPFEDIDYAKIDFHRKVRQGASEVIYGAGKTDEQILGIVEKMTEKGQELILITRISRNTAECIRKRFPIQYDEAGRIGVIGDFPKPDGIGKIVIATGGTSDIPVAKEAEITAKALGNEVMALYDVGVAGVHRLLSNMELLMDATVVIAIAGMEGALASVIGGLVDCPVVAVPTSVGYGASFDGLSALLSMLNSCASGVSVMNIDNGFGAGYFASLVNHMEGKR